MTILCAIIKFIGKLLLGIAYALLKIASFSVEIVQCNREIVLFDLILKVINPNIALFIVQRLLFSLTIVLFGFI